MKTVTLEVSSIETTKHRMKAAFRGEQQDCTISFTSFDVLWKVLAPNRWKLVEALTSAGPLGVRELARRVGRDVRAVHADAQILARAGIIDKDPNGKLSFPYDAVHVDFTMKAA